VVLLDFGVAKLLDAAGPSLTTSRNAVGTFTYMSPEQILGQHIDARTDVYALGALTYRMLVGELPFEAQPEATLRHLHLYMSPPRASLRARMSLAFDEVLLRAMSKDPAARPPTAAAFLASFRAAVEAARRTSSAPPAASARRGLAIYAEVQADADALDRLDDDLLADLEAILPFVSTELTNAGLSMAVEMSDSVLFIVERPEDPALDAEARRRAVDTALAVARKLDRRPGRDPRVHVRLCVHADQVLVTSKGAPVGGALVELAAWAPDDLADGVYASPEALAGLGIAPRPAAQRAGALLRIDGARAR
jgi:serine/threonine-protein kinase